MIIPKINLTRVSSSFRDNLDPSHPPKTKVNAMTLAYHELDERFRTCSCNYYVMLMVITFFGGLLASDAQALGIFHSAQSSWCSWECSAFASPYSLFALGRQTYHTQPTKTTITAPAASCTKFAVFTAPAQI